MPYRDLAGDDYFLRQLSQNKRCGPCHAFLTRTPSGAQFVTDHITHRVSMGLKIWVLVLYLKLLTAFKKKLFTVIISRPADRLYLTKQVDSLNCHAVNWVHILYYTVTIIPCVCAWYSQLCRNRTVCGFNGCSLTCTPILHVLNITCFLHLPHTEYWISITFSTSNSCILWPYIPGYFWCCILSACDYYVITRNLDFRVVYYKCKLWI